MKTIVDFANLIKTYLTKQDGNKNLLGSKNLCVNIAQDSGSWSGITFTVNADKSVTLSGTSTGNPTRLNLSDLGCMGNADVEAITLYKPADIGLDITKDLYGRIGVENPPSGVQIRIRCYDSTKTALGELQFRTGDTRNISTSYPTTTYVNFYITVGQNIAISSPLTIYPYIYYVDDINLDTYYPYAASNIKLTGDTTGLVENIFNNGSVNLLPSRGKTTVTGGITFTCNDDGTIDVNGTATADLSLNIFHASQTDNGESKAFFGKHCHLSGCPAGGSNATYTLAAYKVGSPSSATSSYYDTGNGVDIIPSNDYSQTGTTWSYQIAIKKNTVCNHLLFKPMITLKSQPNSDYAHYVPYAATNKQLTDRLNGLGNFPFIYSISDYFYHMKITTQKQSGLFAKILTPHGELHLITTSSAFNNNIMQNQKVLIDNSASTAEWTYSINGLTIDINCTGHLICLILSNAPLDIQTVDTSTPETNTMNTLNLALLSNS